MVISFLPKSALHKPILWVTASIISLTLLALVVMKADLSEVQGMLKGLSFSALGFAIFFLFMEGIITALRIWLFAGRKTCISPALRANAWYVLLLVLLPARLGEVAAVVIFERYLGQKYGAAAMSIMTQRLYDVIVLGTFFLIALLGIGVFLDTNTLMIIGAVLVAFSLFVLVKLDKILTITVLIFGKKNIRKSGISRKIGRLLLQARMYARHNLKGCDVPLALLLSAGKWICNLGALVFLFQAIHLDLSFLQGIITAAAYNFLAIIPLQTIGGIGVGEAGLALILAGMGITASMAAGASLLIRFVILTFPFIFWVSVMGGLGLKKRTIK